MIADYDTLKAGRWNPRYLLSVPQEEVYFPDEVVFPFAEARRVAIRGMAPTAGIADAPPSDVPLPFGDDAVRADAPVALPEHAVHTCT